MKKTTLQLFRKSLSTFTALALVAGTFGFSLGAGVPLAYADTAPTTAPATSITASDATLNGVNGDTAASDSSFWVSTSTFSTTPVSPLPAGVYSTPLLGAVAANAPFSAQLSTVAGLLPVTSNTTYYFVAWTDVGGTWSPGAVESFTTLSAPTITNISPASGPTTGGTSITITGTDFVNGATVTVGGTPATSVVVVSPTSITATTPAGIAGAQDVVVTNTDGGTVTSTGGFTYVAPVGSESPTTLPATNITASDATLNGMNGGSAATGHSFWVSTSTFSTASPTLPTGVYSTADLGALAANAPSSAALSSVTGILPVTQNTTYYFAAWSEVDGTWHPGEVLSFTTASPGSGTIGGTVTGSGTLAVTSVDAVDTTGTADGAYENGWKYVFNITIPTDEPNVAMKFSDWTSGANILPVGGNMRISSAQANNGGATIPVVTAGVYTTPDLHMTTDLDPATPGIQVQLTVEVKIPVGTPSASYTTNYGVRSE